MLPPHLRAILKHIDETVNKADRGANDRSKSAEETQNKIVASIDGLANEFKSYQAEQTETERKKNRRENLTIGSLIVTAAITLALAVIAGLQWWTFEKQWMTLEKSDQTLRDTLETNRASQRPFVTLRELKIEAGDRLKYRDPTQKYWSFRVLLENSGSTVTRNLKIYHGYAFSNGPGPGDITLEQLSQGGGNASIVPHSSIDPIFLKEAATKYRNLVLGPHATEIVAGIAVSADFLKPTTPHWYIYGMAAYDDIFPHEDRRHVTKYCYEVLGLVSADQTPSVATCAYWNCADEECEADKKAYDAEAVSISPRK